MNLSFNEEQMRALVTKAIVDGLGDEQKTLLISRAIEGLMEPAKRDQWGQVSDKRSKLEVAFDTAASAAMLQVAREELNKPENVEQLRKLVESSVARLFSVEHVEQVTSRLAFALRDALTGQKE
jgi:hypothetical protein